MQNVLKRVLSCGMALLMCLGITTAVRTVVSVTDYTVADAATSADYYADISATKGTQLLGQLHDLIVSTHKRYTSYDDCRTYGPKTDPGLDGRGALEFYTHETVMSFSGTVGTWNREHVWCKSLSNGLWKTSNGGSDLHHIRPSEGGLNSTRGSNKYGEVTGGKEAWSRKVGGANSMLGGHVGGGVFEPLDNVKGDAARIVMYMYTHYNSASRVGGTVNSQGSGTLNFTHIMSAGSEDSAKELLLEWNRLDPVDDIERYRNEEVFKIQGNRNPFIDNSSYADAIWGNGSVVDPPAPDKAKLTVTPSSLTLKEGQSQKLTVTFNPASATSSVNWNSDNPAVASVSSLGTVTANAEGTAKIYAVSASDSSVKNYATVTVTKDGGGTVTPPTPANSATITADSFSLSGSYGFHSWQEGGISGTAFIYGGNSSSMQFNSSKASQYIASTTSATSGITSVEVKLNSKTTANKNWKLLTSNTPYGEVPGKPTDGNDHGVKAVTQEGVIWTLNGNDKYFTLNYEDTGACYLESVTVTFGGNGGGDPVLPPEPPVNEKLEAFHNAVMAIDNDGTIEEREEQIAYAESIYETLTANGKVEAWEDLKILIAARQKLEQDKNDGVDPNPDVDQKKLEYFYIIVAAIVENEDAPLEERKVDIDLAYAIAETFTADERKAAAEKMAELDAAYEKYKQDFEASNTQESANVKAFKTAVASIPSSGSAETRFNAIKNAIKAYNKLTDGEKSKVTAEKATLDAAVTAYNEMINSYNSSAGVSSDIAVGAMKNFFEHVNAFLAVLVKIR